MVVVALRYIGVILYIELILLVLLMNIRTEFALDVLVGVGVGIVVNAKDGRKIVVVIVVVL